MLQPDPEHGRGGPAGAWPHAARALPRPANCPATQICIEGRRKICLGLKQRMVHHLMVHHLMVRYI